MKIRVELPANLCRLAHVDPLVELEVGVPPTQRSMMEALEAKLPALQGTVRDHTTQMRRPYLRFFACNEDISHQDIDQPLPLSVANGSEPLLIIGAVSGG
jgi:molybdopterin synthase sulfur carrier subunit